MQKKYYVGKNINKHEEEEETQRYVVVIFSSILYLTNYFIL